MNLAEAVEHIRLRGFCVVEGLLSPEEAEPLRERLPKAGIYKYDPKSKAQADSQGFATGAGVINFDPSIASHLANRRILDIAEALLGSHVRVSVSGCVVNHPGTNRREWHADWPYNQGFEVCLPSPYPDLILQLATLWMLSPFRDDNGGTLVVPGSHRSSNNPTGDNGVEPYSPCPGELQVTGTAGSVLVYDSRLWHASGPNRSDSPRVALVARYVPWWLNLNPIISGSAEFEARKAVGGKKVYAVPPVSTQTFAALPDHAKPLFLHAREKVS